MPARVYMLFLLCYNQCMNKNEMLEALLAAGTIRKAAAKMLTSVTNFRYWMRRHNVVFAGKKQCSVNAEKFKEAVACSVSVAGVLRILGRSAVGSGYRLVWRLVQEMGLDTSHWKGQAHGTSKQDRIPLSELLTINSSHRIGDDRKKRLVKEGLLKERCYECGIGPEWNDRPMILVLDHINGVRNDNRIENLRFLCPNCNSQTDTFCGRNRLRSLMASGDL